MTTYTLPQLLTFAQQAGFSGSSAQTIAGIAYAESSGNANAINTSDPNGGSFGLTQINGAHPNAAATLGNPAEAFAQAYTISAGGTNFSPWSTYTSGAYQPYAQQLGLNPTTNVAGPASSGGGIQNAAFPIPSFISAAGGAIANYFLRAAIILVGIVIIWQGLAMLRNTGGATKIVENINVKGGPTHTAKRIASKVKEATA